MIRSPFSCLSNASRCEDIVPNTPARHVDPKSAHDQPMCAAMRTNSTSSYFHPEEYAVINRRHQHILQDEAADFSKHMLELTGALSLTGGASFLSSTSVGSTINTHLQAATHSDDANGVQRSRPPTLDGVLDDGEEDIRITFPTDLVDSCEHEYESLAPSFAFDWNKPPKYSS
ncbi:hypothetical protein STCU_09908 [Strigomonas culicis]|uniref:Uncharacterized protein n=1 Tax=Strigomonas culicis TaxID=28005 RepID=S9TJW2_9TRYP|nr:hypothetical protein STCU_09908 [Strigomonas culicis]|eukprot:EPY18442.1 hypothetical protein STCU_09908 [Strigomonas culicis]